jgi:hypothetical protein
MWKANPNISSDGIAYPQGMPQEQLEAGRQELVTFTETTLQHLIKAERLAYHHKPSIELFCRMDIGVMPDDTGKLQYFVNEVTRGPTVTCLFWANTLDLKMVASNLGADFAVAFHKYLCNQHPDLHKTKA